MTDNSDSAEQIYAVQFQCTRADGSATGESLRCTEAAAHTLSTLFYGLSCYLDRTNEAVITMTPIVAGMVWSLLGEGLPAATIHETIDQLVVEYRALGGPDFN